MGGDLAGTPDYDLGLGLIMGLTSAECEESGKYSLASFEWPSSSDISKKIMATSLTYDFENDGMMYICSTGPLVEEDLEEETDVAVDTDLGMEINMKNLELIPDFQWEEAPAYADYDFMGNLEFCGGVANEIEWPEYFAEENISGAIFAYRQYGMSDLPCGDEMSPRLNLIPGKKYKINFINTSGSPTNLHTHGLHIGGNYYLDDVFRLVNPGECAH